MVPSPVLLSYRSTDRLFASYPHRGDVEGRLREGYDALDAFLAVTGAPKQVAIQFILRRWCGAMGLIGFNGNMNTGLICALSYSRLV